MPRRAAKKDANHNEIKQVFENLNCGVVETYQLGDGVPDMFVYCFQSHRWQPVEVKDGSKRPSARKLTPDEQKWALKYPLTIVETSKDAFDLVQRMRRMERP